MGERAVAVVTGATAGVGRATARLLARRGFDVALVARGQAGLEATVKDVQTLGARALPLSVDVCDFGEVDGAASRVESELGPIELWINDAMTTVFAPAWEVEPEAFRRAVEVTFLGQVWGTLAALKRMRPQDHGTIVNVGSALAFVGIPLQSPYCASKFACRGFFESVRAELVHTGSHVTMAMVHLPAVNTPQFDWCDTTLDRKPQPVAPIYQPELCAAHIVRSALSGRSTRVLGSWNRMLVIASRLWPAFANQFAAIDAWDAQLSGEPIDHGRRANLFTAVDGEHDHGSRGSFGDRAGGFLDASFLETLPATAKNAGTAAAKTFAEYAQRVTRLVDRASGGRVGIAMTGLQGRARPQHPDEPDAPL
ncbi:MAG: SDR family oxidoreductase [Acidimicrobiales bacterium]